MEARSLTKPMLTQTVVKDKETRLMHTDVELLSMTLVFSESLGAATCHVGLSVMAAGSEWGAQCA